MKIISSVCTQKRKMKPFIVCNTKSLVLLIVLFLYANKQCRWFFIHWNLTQHTTWIMNRAVQYTKCSIWIKCQMKRLLDWHIKRWIGFIWGNTIRSVSGGGPRILICIVFIIMKRCKENIPDLDGSIVCVCAHAANNCFCIYFLPPNPN